MTKEQRFLEQYAVCIDDVGNVKVCGREACQSLISLASEIDGTVEYGDVATGFMHVENMCTLNAKLRLDLHKL